MGSPLIQNGKQIVLDIVDDMPPAGRLFARVPVSYSDFQLARDETWWSGVRTGELEPDLSRYELRVMPGQESQGGLLDGYAIELVWQGGSFRRQFDIRSLSNLAQRAVVNLVKDQALALGDDYKYYLKTLPADARATEPAGTPRIRVQHEPLTIEATSLADMMGQSEPYVGVSEQADESGDPCMPIFVTGRAWEESREQAFRGGENESAALFSGRLFRDTASPEVFLCLEACLEAAHAVEDKVSVTFTGETWARARQLLAIRRQRLNRPHEIVVGSVHRHPFLPAADANGCRMCELCSVAKYCSRSTAVPSTDDFEWHRSVFAGQPWSTLLIWGYNAREQEDFRCYGLKNASFKQRSIRILKRD